MGHGMEQVHIQSLVSGRPIETLNVSVLRRLARLDILHRDPVVVGPVNERSAEKLRAVVTANRGGFSAPFNDVF